MGGYRSEEEIRNVIVEFESATIARDKWKHAEHLTVALYYLTQYDLETATDKMRSGIMNLLTSGFGLDLSKEMPYHETLTVFWMRTVAAFDASKNDASLVDKANELTETFDKDYPLRFYSREYLFSDDARASFLPPDLNKID